MSKEALERAIGCAGSQWELHRRLKAAGERISQQAIGLWLKGSMPSRWAVPVARAVEFQVTPHELDKDAYPNPWDGLPVDRARPLIMGLAPGGCLMRLWCAWRQSLFLPKGCLSERVRKGVARFGIRGNP